MKLKGNFFKTKKVFLILLLIVILFLIALILLRKLSDLKRPGSLYKKEEVKIVADLENRQIPIQETSKVITFAVIADIHLGATPEIPSLLEEALSKAKELGVNFVIAIGDLTNTGSLREFQILKQTLDGSGLEYYVVPGNHDIGKQAVKEGAENFRFLFGDPYKEVVYKIKNTGQVQSKMKEVRLFLLDSSAIGTRDRIIDSQQWLWLKQKLGDLPWKESELRLVFSQLPFDKFPWTEQHYLREFYCNAFIDGLFEADVHRSEHFFRDCPFPAWKFGEDFYYQFPEFKPGALYQPYRQFPGFLIMDYYDNHFFGTKRAFVGDLKSQGTE